MRCETKRGQKTKSEVQVGYHGQNLTHPLPRFSRRRFLSTCSAAMSARDTPRGPPGAGVARCGDIHLRTRAAMSARGPAGGIFLGHLLSFGTCTILEIALRSKKQFHFFACLGLEPWGLDQADTSSWRMHVSSPRTASHMCSMIKCRGCSRRHAAASRLLPRERRCCIRTHTASSYSRKRLPTCWQH